MTRSVFFRKLVFQYTRTIKREKTRSVTFGSINSEVCEERPGVLAFATISSKEGTPLYHCYLSPNIQRALVEYLLNISSYDREFVCITGIFIPTQVVKATLSTADPSEKYVRLFFFQAYCKDLKIYISSLGLKGLCIYPSGPF